MQSLDEEKEFYLGHAREYWICSIFIAYKIFFFPICNIKYSYIEFISPKCIVVVILLLALYTKLHYIKIKVDALTQYIECFGHKRDVMIKYMKKIIDRIMMLPLRSPLPPLSSSLPPHPSWLCQCSGDLLACSTRSPPSGCSSPERAAAELHQICCTIC